MTNRIDIVLREAISARKLVLAPYVTIGFPSVKASISVAESLLNSGGDLLELGVPFSDPLADGSTIQKANLAALKQDVDLSICINAVRHLRKNYKKAPIVLMGYFNPFLYYGLTNFVKDASNAGVDGIIVPDLPLEESSVFGKICRGKNIHLIPLLAPTSTSKRISQTCKQAKGFIYCVSLTGVTGARRELRSDIEALVSRIRRHTDLPVLVGFGISKHEHFKSISKFADGAVFASALLDAIGNNPHEEAAQTAGEFIRGIRLSVEQVE